MATRIQKRRDTAANWALVNPTLAQGEEGLELDTGKEKVGNGTSAWNSLPYKTLGLVPGAIGAEASGAAASAVAAHVAQSDPHPVYATAQEVSAAIAGKVDSTDARLSDSRTPTAHKATHATGGTDALTPGDIGAEAAGAAAAAQAAAIAAAAADATTKANAAQAAAIAASATAAQGAKADTAVQPAGLTKAAVGLGNVDNTSDADKPVSTATAAALAAKEPAGAAATAQAAAIAAAAGLAIALG